MPSMFQQHRNSSVSVTHPLQLTVAAPSGRPATMSFLWLVYRQTGEGSQRERERAKEEGGREGETRQDRAFSLEIITFTLLMYGQTTKDIRRQ